VGRVPFGFSIATARWRFKPDVLYVRWSPWFPGQSTVTRGIPSVIEINSAFWQELASSKLFRVLDKVTTRRLFSAADKLVAPTVEIARELKDRYAVSDSQLEIVANGVPSAPDGLLSRPSDDRCSIAFACGDLNTPWHGVDRVLAIAARTPEFDYQLFGHYGDLTGPSNVTFRGVLDRSALTSELQQCTIGIGTLALERKGMIEACALKTREYLSNGLPVALNHIDTDFSADRWFIGELSTPGSFDLDSAVASIRAFVSDVVDRRVTADDVEGFLQRDKEACRLVVLRQAIESGR
jgi:hypothetical protein